MQEVIVFGAGKIAEVVHDYLTKDSGYRIAAFCVDAAFRNEDNFLGLPLISFEDAPCLFAPDRFQMMMALGYHDCNALRSRKSAEARKLGYRFATYINSRAWVANSATLGEGCIVLDHVSVEPKAQIGCNAMLWSGAVVGHHARLGDHVWMAASSIVGGGASLGEGSFLGLGAIVGHEVTLGQRCLVGANSFVGKDATDKFVLLSPEAVPHRLDVDYFLRFSGKL
jgi:sugar O-acyltransferase (sialic acid O-acetyltransferase NeuD family)